jgi:hypothetical protein
MTARPLYTLIARIRWPASNPIVLFEREIWELRGEATANPRRILLLLLRESTTENVVAPAVYTSAGDARDIRT